AGYIGSHMLVELLDIREHLVLLDTPPALPGRSLMEYHWSSGKAAIRRSLLVSSASTMSRRSSTAPRRTPFSRGSNDNPSR
ncbi:MAG: hypothetical protein ABSA58_20080, partial [Acetobacteraceae bacterium]